MASVTLDQACIRLRAGLLAESTFMNFAGDPKLGSPSPPIIAVRERSKLDEFWSLRAAAKVSFVSLPDAKFKAARVQVGPSGNSLWVPPDFGDYRDAFALFLVKFEGVTATLSGSGYHVDHIYNASRANFFTYALVRMTLVKGRINIQHGSSYEKAIGVADQVRGGKTMQLLDAMNELKVLGLPPVKADGKLLPEHHTAAREAAALYGISYDLALDGIKALCGRAHGR